MWEKVDLLGSPWLNFDQCPTSWYKLICDQFVSGYPIKLNQTHINASSHGSHFLREKIFAMVENTLLKMSYRIFYLNRRFYFDPKWTFLKKKYFCRFLRRENLSWWWTFPCFQSFSILCIPDTHSTYQKIYSNYIHYRYLYITDLVVKVKPS